MCSESPAPPPNPPPPSPPPTCAKLCTAVIIFEAEAGGGATPITERCCSFDLIGGAQYIGYVDTDGGAARFVAGELTTPTYAFTNSLEVFGYKPNFRTATAIVKISPTKPIISKPTFDLSVDISRVFQQIRSGLCGVGGNLTYDASSPHWFHTEGLPTPIQLAILISPNIMTSVD